MVKYFNKIELIESDLISPNNWNANSVNRQTKEAIDDDISQNGFIGEIILQKHNTDLGKDFVIINGEHRFNILKQKGEKQIPCIVLDVDDNKARVLSVRLNKEHGELLPDKVSQILLKLSPDRDLTFLKNETGISFDELEVLTEMDFKDDTINLNESKKEKQSTKISVKCPQCNFEFEITK